MNRLLVFSFVLVGMAGLAAALSGQTRTVVVPPGQAAITVRLPANAELLIDNKKYNQSGSERVFFTPTLVEGFRYSFEFEARWTENGQQKKVNKSVAVKAGESKFIDLTQADTVTKVEPKKDKEPGKETKKDPVVPKGEPKTRKFYFTYAAIVKDLKPGTEADIWLPVPSSTPEQEVSMLSQDLPGKATIGQEKQYGNKAVYFKAKADDKGEIPFKVTYAVLRREVRTDQKGNLYVKPRPGEALDRFLKSDKLVPIEGKPLELLGDVKLSGDSYASAKQMYDLVNTHMKYSKEGKGWGRGDSVWACDSKFGNCTDFHSLFISMARGNKIHAKFEMGFPVPTKRGKDAIGGYHCWAWFMPDGKGWIPVDISEANRYPEMKEYYFGNLTEDRVQFTTGRDIDLEPRQKGAALNFFIYPYVEVEGQTHPQEKITRSFSYEDVK